MTGKKETQQGESRRFYKSRKDKMIDGVCGGLAEYLKVDGNVVRIVWLLSILIKGLGIIAYIFAMIIIPVNPAHKDMKEGERRKRNPIFFWGIALIIIGFLILFNQWDWPYHWHFPWHFRFLPWWGIPWGTLWPLGLVALGIAYIIYVLRKERRGDDREEKEGSGRDDGKKLQRTPEEKIVGGVCGGIGRYLRVDSTIIRIGLIVIALATDVLLWIIIYAILLIVIPQEKIDGIVVNK